MISEWTVILIEAGDVNYVTYNSYHEFEENLIALWLDVKPIGIILKVVLRLTISLHHKGRIIASKIYAGKPGHGLAARNRQPPRTTVSITVSIYLGLLIEHSTLMSMVSYVQASNHKISYKIVSSSHSNRHAACSNMKLNL